VAKKVVEKHVKKEVKKKETKADDSTFVDDTIKEMNEDKN